MRRTPESLLSEVESELIEQPSSESAAFRRFLNLPTAARYALEPGEDDKAKCYAQEALDFVKAHSSNARFDAGEAFFYCHLVLGRLALLEGDMSQAEEHLIESGKTAGSPSLDTFGPNMSLARELLKRSRSETVLKYFDECKAFWRANDERGRLSRWSRDVQAGRMPEFGANLFY